MSSAFKCDFCTRCFDPFDVGGAQFLTIEKMNLRDASNILSNTLAERFENIHACPECTKDLLEFYSDRKLYSYAKELKDTYLYGYEDGYNDGKSSQKKHPAE